MDYVKKYKSIALKYQSVVLEREIHQDAVVVGTREFLEKLDHTVGDLDEETKKRVHKEHRTKITLDVMPMGIPAELYDVEISGLRKEHLYR